MTLFDIEDRAGWIRLRTTTVLRWIALAGQSAAVLAAVLVFGLSLPLGPVIAAIASLAAANLVCTALWSGQVRLRPLQAAVLIGFDVVQLAVILALTGGLSNPFVMLMLAPVAIGATLLPQRIMLAVVTLAAVLVTALWWFYIPLAGPDGVLELPALFRFGTWVAAETGMVFLSLYARRVTREMHAMGDALNATQSALARAQKLTDLGGVVAATAHEMGTPLATIQLTASELADLLDDQPELASDAELIVAQAKRCKTILHSMGQAGKDDALMRQAPAQAIVEEAAGPHRGRGIAIEVIAAPEGPPTPQPEIARAPEIIHGLRNLIQNGVDYAASRVTIHVLWSAQTVTVRVADDGPGYPPGLIDRIGEPLYDRPRSDPRAGYEGMGLGLFIARTLLERSGAELRFANGTGARQGAIVDVTWPRDTVEQSSRRALGENPINL